MNCILLARVLKDLSKDESVILDSGHSSYITSFASALCYLIKNPGQLFSWVKLGQDPLFMYFTEHAGGLYYDFCAVIFVTLLPIQLVGHTEDASFEYHYKRDWCLTISLYLTRACSIVWRCYCHNHMIVGSGYVSYNKKPCLPIVIVLEAVYSLPFHFIWCIVACFLLSIPALCVLGLNYID